MNEDRRQVSGESPETSSSNRKGGRGARGFAGARRRSGRGESRRAGTRGTRGRGRIGNRGVADRKPGASRPTPRTMNPVRIRAASPARRPGEGDEAGETVESLRMQLDEARGEAQEEREAALRARAETENVRRRAARDVEHAHRFGVEGLIGELLPVRDGLELGIKAAHEEGGSVKALVEGHGNDPSHAGRRAGEVRGGRDRIPRGKTSIRGFHQAMFMREAEGVEAGKGAPGIPEGVPAERPGRASGHGDRFQVATSFRQSRTSLRGARRISG